MKKQARYLIYNVTSQEQHYVMKYLVDILDEVRVISLLNTTVELFVTRIGVISIERKKIDLIQQDLS